MRDTSSHKAVAGVPDSFRRDTAVIVAMVLYLRLRLFAEIRESRDATIAQARMWKNEVNVELFFLQALIMLEAIAGGIYHSRTLFLGDGLFRTGFPVHADPVFVKDTGASRLNISPQNLEKDTERLVVFSMGGHRLASSGIATTSEGVVEVWLASFKAAKSW